MPDSKQIYPSVPGSNYLPGSNTPAKNGNTATPVNPEIDVEFGVNSMLPFGGWSTTQTGNQSGGTIIGNDPKAVPLDNLAEMRRHDGQARALMRLMALPVRAAMKDSKWIEPPNQGGGEAEAEFANTMFNLPPAMGGMSVPKNKLLKQTLLALMDGFSVFEEVRHIPEDGPLAGQITLRKLAYRDARTVSFIVDDTGGFNGVRQIATMPGGRTVDVEIARDKVIYYAANEEENPYYGVSMFEAAYYHYEIKKKLYYLAHIASQFAAVPGRMGKMKTPGSSLKEMESVKKMLASFAFNTSGIMPANWDLQLVNNNTQFDFLKLIDHHNTMMAASVLAKFLQQEDRQVLIDNGKADASADLFVMAIESIMNEIAELWTIHLMPKYIDWNFGSKNYPIFQFGQLTDSAKDTIKEIFETVVIAGTLNCTPEFVRETEKTLSKRLGYDIDYEEIAQAEAEQAKSDAEAQAQEDALQAQQQQAAAEAAAQPPAPAAGAGKPPAKPAAGPSSSTSQQIKASHFGLNDGDGFFDQVITAAVKQLQEQEAVEV